ncbi:MAG TPA: HAD-IA family hydrolase [Jiangellales bacterium]|nr:HAD-IA family hydrolase [Jiangellales bacterium]
MSHVVMFDLDGTIVDHVGAAIQAVAAWVAEIAPATQCDDDLANLWMSLEREHFGAYLAGQCSFEQQRRHRLRGFLPRLGMPVDDTQLDDQFTDYLRHYEASWMIYPDVADTLVALRSGGFALAVLTNGDGRQQRRKLTEVGLRDAFDLIVCSSELGVAKPDPVAFHLATRRMGRRPEDVWYVGDDLHVDCRAARHAELHGILLNRLARHSDLPVDQISRLTDLPGRLPAPPGVPDRSRAAPWRSALTRFADTVGPTIPWAVTGSAALAIYGVDVEPNDVDVITDRSGLAAVHRLAGTGSVDEPFESSDVAAEARLRFDLDGVAFEVLVGVRNLRSDGSWSSRATPADRVRIPSRGNIPVLPLSSLLAIAEERKRAVQSAAIRARLRRWGIGDRALPRREPLAPRVRIHTEEVNGSIPASPTNRSEAI